MKSVSLPSIIYDDLISSCIGSIESTDLSDRLESATVHLRNAGNLYNTCATNSNLFQTISFLGDDDDIVVGYVTKKELKNYKRFDKNYLNSLPLKKRFFYHLAMIYPQLLLKF